MELPATTGQKFLSVLRYAFGKAMSFVKRAGNNYFQFDCPDLVHVQLQLYVTER